MEFKNAAELSKHIAADFRDFEEHEIVVFKDRDASLVQWAINCMTNPRNEWAAEMLNRMQERLKINTIRMRQEQSPSYVPPKEGDVTNAPCYQDGCKYDWHDVAWLAENVQVTYCDGLWLCPTHYAEFQREQEVTHG